MDAAINMSDSMLYEFLVMIATIWKNYLIMKILLINPSRYYYDHSYYPSSSLPLGLLSIAGLLRKNEVNVEILDCLNTKETTYRHYQGKTILGLTPKSLCNKIKIIDPDIVGVSCPFSAQWDSFCDTMKLVKTLKSNVTIVAGGAHFSGNFNEWLVQCPELDFIIIGEGEYAFLDLVNHFLHGKKIACEKVNNIRVLDTRKQSQVKELDLLPFPAYDLIDMEQHFNMQLAGYSDRKGVLARAMPMITSRGCPFNCSFCSSYIHMGNKYRSHSEDYVINHINHVAQKYDVKHVFFEDDNLCYSRKRIMNILDRLSKSKYAVTWSTPNGVRADTLDYELIQKMKISGCTSLMIASESGSQEIIDNNLGKFLSIHQIQNVALWCKENSLPLSCFFMFGIPGETKADIKKTFEFALYLFKEYDVLPTFNRACPLPGTRMMKIAKDNNFLCHEVSPKSLSEGTYPNGKGLLKTPSFSPDELTDMYYSFCDDFKKKWYFHRTTHNNKHHLKKLGVL